MHAQIIKQYEDDKNLNARIQLHALFSTNALPWQQWVFHQLHIPAKATILELGCGPGTLWVQNAVQIPAGWDIILSDFSDGMLDAAWKNLRDSHHKFRYRNINAENIPFDECSFDAVIANHMLYHVPDQSRALSEIKRVLKPGGQLYASTVGERHMVEMWALLQPFAPHLLERRATASSNFTLENGASQLAEFFEEIKRIEYEDNLDITDVEPVIAYLHSSTTLADFELTETAIAYVSAKINAAIAENGAFHVGKASGLFTATRLD